MAAPLEPFPIQRLPHVPLLEVLKFMDPTEIIAVSQTSKKSYGKIRQEAKRLSFDLSLFVFEYAHSLIFWQRTRRCEELLVIHDEYTPTHNTLFDYTTKPVSSRCSDLHEGYRDIIDFLNDLFSIKSVSVDFAGCWQLEINTLLQHIKHIGLKMDEIVLRGPGDHDEEIIGKCDGARMLRLIDPRNCNVQSIHLEQLVIKTPDEYDASHLDTVLNSKAVVIKLGCGGVNLDEFWKKWMAGRYELKYFEMTVNRNPFDLPKMVEGMEAEMMERYAVNHGGEIHEFQPNQCYRVKRPDGDYAMLYTIGDVITFRKKCRPPQ
ncbi:hypothetical protein GCK72_003360 [Caenorhabditis remanei]|uniref:F-box domain-containing protein n=1 Tax=Caenorhabditis remanei TaxID=31234 RepID=A0A6A5HY41_CAERE|nr:hypothetical protein GCK72_003360 [Caenorhabditis remanei]KAF1771533.1 hypothetical protein GCK72_003360 [Caenorhabditis remanei]